MVQSKNLVINNDNFYSNPCLVSRNSSSDMKNLKITDKIISADVSSPLNIDFSYDTLKHTHRNEVIFLYSIVRTLFFNFLEFKEQDDDSVSQPENSVFYTSNIKVSMM